MAASKRGSGSCIRPSSSASRFFWQLSQKFPVVTNIRQCSVTDEIGIVSLELDGERSDIKAAIKWLEKIGVSVEPVDINVDLRVKHFYLVITGPEFQN